MSRDELNVLVVSYAELKNCLEQVKLILDLYTTNDIIKIFTSLISELWGSACCS